MIIFLPKHVLFFNEFCYDYFQKHVFYYSKNYIINFLSKAFLLFFIESHQDYLFQSMFFDLYISFIKFALFDYCGDLFPTIWW